LFSRGKFPRFIEKLFLGDVASVGAPASEAKRLRLTHPPEPEFPPLNASQVTAIDAALNSKVTMIQGPPGTGKATVIAALALSFVRSGVHPVLVCAQSNVATEHVTSRIAAAGCKVVRVLATAREQLEDPEFTSKRLAVEAFGEAANALEGRRNEATIIHGAQVVTSTCVSAGGSRLNGLHPRVIIFDEAGQCTDPDLLIPLTRGAERVILVGDHK
jgi:regulator of nonsense transcripts 1